MCILLQTNEDESPFAHVVAMGIIIANIVLLDMNEDEEI
jgi:hypothetical protein